MHVDADDANAIELGGTRIDLARSANRYAEFVLGLASRDLGVGLRIDVGIDADRDVGAAILVGGDGGKKLELRLRFNVDAENTVLDRERELVLGLADAGEHNFCRRNAGSARAQEFAAGDDVGTGAETRERRNHGLIGICFHRVADERVHVGECLRKYAVMPLKRRGRIAIERRTDRIG